MQPGNKSERLGTQPILSLLINLSIPSVLAMAIQALYNVVDSIYVARLSTDALSALSLCFPIQMIIIGIAVGTGVGASSLISRLLGSDQKDSAVNTTEHALITGIIYGIICFITGLLFSEDLLRLFTKEAALIEMGSEYISIILMGSVFMFIPMISNNILRGQGNTFVPMITMLIGSVLNIILDPLFIFGIGFFPRWEIEGAAFATVLSRVVNSIFILYIIFNIKNNELVPDFRKFKPDFSILKEIYKVGFPAIVMQLLASFMIGGMNIILAGYSSIAVAAAGVYFRLQSFVFMPVFGLNQAYLPILGYNYGKGNISRIEKVIFYSFIIALGFSTTGLILFQLFPEGFVLMFNNDSDLVITGAQALKIISISFPLSGIVIVGATTFQAFGRGLPSLVLSFLRSILLLLPIMYFLAKYWGLAYSWYAFPISEFITCAIGCLWLLLVVKKALAEKSGSLPNG